ncbi:MAG: hypothetical protein M3R15_32225 [Acidobacteriota bacterium]|nr:hypothetical protein [Acidobacteriota bacterium]
MRQSIDVSINHLTGGCESRFARLLAVNLRTEQCWRDGKFLPDLKHLLQIAYLLKLPVSHFVAGQLESDWMCREKGGASAPEAQSPHPPCGMRSTYPRRKIHDTVTLAQALCAELAKEHPRSYQELATSLGYQHYGAMYQRLPELCRALKNKWIAVRRQQLREMEAMLEAALAEEPPPSMVTLSRRCEGGRGGALRNNYPALCVAVLARHMAYVKEEMEKVPDKLAAALVEEPPRTMIEVAKRLGYDQSTLRKKYSSLCQAIAARYKAYRKERSERKKQELTAEVRQVGESLT